MCEIKMFLWAYLCYLVCYAPEASLLLVIPVDLWPPRK